MSSYLDVPAYRYQRILHPLLARWLAFGSADRVFITMVLVALAGLVAGTAALERLLLDLKMSRWYALLYGLFGGVFFGVRLSTTEPLAYGLVLLAILAQSRERSTLAAILLALAAFAKETTLIFALGYGLYFVIERRWLDAIRLGAITVLPFAAWQWFLVHTFGQFGVGSGGALSTSFEIIPYMGIWRLFGFGTPGLALAIVAIPVALIPSLWALWRGGRDVLARRWHPYLFLMLANAAVLPFVPFSTYREPLSVFRFVVGLVIGVVLYAALRRDVRALRYCSFWVMFSWLPAGEALGISGNLNRPT
ncbi:MAG TPA: glycosyltransferase 87 family protein [Aggregatilineales bacterium]|nr:glycosyltransferase 87 family protein [Aggregatilineales bacterium]